MAAIGSGWPAEAEASQCSGITQTASNVEVVVTPETPCIEVVVSSPGCGDNVSIEVTNTCATTLALPGTPGQFVCAADPDQGASEKVTCEVQTGETDWTYPRVDNDRVDAVYIAQLDDADIEIRVGFDVETTSPDDSGGCAVSAASTGHRSKGGGATSGRDLRSGSFLALAMVVAAVTRRLSRRSAAEVTLPV